MQLFLVKIKCLHFIFKNEKYPKFWNKIIFLKIKCFIISKILFFSSK